MAMAIAIEMEMEMSSMLECARYIWSDVQVSVEHKDLHVVVVPVLKMKHLCQSLVTIAIIQYSS